MQAKVFTGIRIIFGLQFVVFGLNGFFQFLPMQAPTPEAGAFLGALMATGYMIPIIKGLEVLVGISMLANKYVPLALIVIFPIVVNIFLVHAVLDRSGFIVGLIVLAFNLALAWKNKNSYTNLLKA